MPLDDLVSVIEILRERLQTHRQVLEANETRTRMALIDPLLQALGWDTADPALVLPEYDLSGNENADYALLDGTGKPVALRGGQKARRISWCRTACRSSTTPIYRAFRMPA